MAPKARTLLHASFWIVSMHSVCRETIFFCRKQRGRGDFFTMPPPPPPPFWDPWQFDWTKLTYCISIPCIIQINTIISPLRRLLGNLFRQPPPPPAREYAGGFKSRIRLPYPERVVKGDKMGQCVGITV